MNREIRKQIKLNTREAFDLADKARRACLTESGLIRALIRGYEPTEKPDDRFYEFTEQLNDVAEALQTIADVAHATGNIDANAYESEVERLHFFIVEIEKKVIQNKESEDWRKTK